MCYGCKVCLITSHLPPTVLLYVYEFPSFRLPALHFSVDFIFLSFGIVGLIVDFKTIRGSLMSLAIYKTGMCFFKRFTALVPNWPNGLNPDQLKHSVWP